VIRLARDNSGWGYDRIVGALANLGHQVSDQTVGNILRRHGIPPAPKRSQTTTWREFIRRHMDILSGAADYANHRTVTLACTTLAVTHFGDVLIMNVASKMRMMPSMIRTKVLGS
jgi:hypothetical protein